MTLCFPPLLSARGKKIDFILYDLTLCSASSGVVAHLLGDGSFSRFHFEIRHMIKLSDRKNIWNGHFLQINFQTAAGGNLEDGCSRKMEKKSV